MTSRSEITEPVTVNERSVVVIDLERSCRDCGAVSGAFIRCERCRKARSDAQRLARPAIERGRTAGSDPAPAIRLRELLTEQRAYGLPWSDAWPRCMRLVVSQLPLRDEQRDWRVAFHETAEAWRAAFLREPAQAQHLVGHLAGLLADSEDDHGQVEVYSEQIA